MPSEALKGTEIGILKLAAVISCTLVYFLLVT